MPILEKIAAGALGRRRRAAWLGALLLLGVPSGCGGGSDPGADAVPTDAAPTDAAPTDAASADAAPDAAGACPVGLPTEPVPGNDATEVDPTLLTALAWTAASDATGYAVYLGSECPPPAYPDPAFVAAAGTTYPVASLELATSYCWQVVALGDACHAVGPVWSFRTSPPCDMAPGCTGAETPPGALAHFTDLDLALLGFVEPLPTPPAVCHAPQLRIRLAEIRVADDVDAVAGDAVYCVVTAESPIAAEVRVTPVTPALQEGETHAFALEETVFWGQVLAPVAPGGNLMISYHCLEQDSPDGYPALLDSLGQAASDVGATPNGDRGWIFPVAGGAATAVSAALALDADDYLLQAQQIVSADSHLDLTSGGYWTVRQSGQSGNETWDWELRVEAWGCADNGTL